MTTWSGLSDGVARGWGREGEGGVVAVVEARGLVDMPLVKDLPLLASTEHQR